MTVTVRGRSLRIRDLAYGMRFIVVVSGHRRLVEVIYVRSKKVGERRVVLRRVDSGSVLRQARSLAELYLPDADGA